MSAEFCKRHEHLFWTNYTGCLNSIRQNDRQIKEVNGLKLSLRQLTQDSVSRRKKRGVFNLVGEISKILFGTMDDHDANYYADKVSQLEREQLDFLKITREQISVVKATLRSVNSTLRTVLENEKILSKGLEGMMNHVNEQDGEIKEMFTIFSLMLTIHEHAVNLNRAIEECRREYQILIDAVIDAQRGVIEPQLITPAQILEQIKNSQADMPNDVSLPFPRSATYLSLLLRIVNIDVFLKGKFLVYIIRVPLTINMDFELYHVLPLPIKIKGTDAKYIFIQPGIEYLLLDTAKRYFSWLEVSELHECQVLTREVKVCKQKRPLQLTQVEEVCEVQMIESIRAIPSYCSKKIVELNHTLWQQLFEDEWLFVAPVVDALTVLCVKHDPIDVTLIGTGRLQLQPMCKAYGNRMFIHSHATIVNNHTNKDVIAPLSLECDSCDSISKSFKLNRLRLHMTMEGVASSFDDLRIANHKVGDVDRFIFENDWKFKHFTVDSNMSFFVVCRRDNDRVNTVLFLLLLLFQMLLQKMF
jgi:hypothetical protein